MQEAESLEGARTHILHVGNAAFEEAYTVLLQKLTEDKTHDRAFLQTISHNAQALSAPLATQKIQVSVQQKGRRISEVVEIGKRISQFRQTLKEEEDKLEGYWKEWESLQVEFKTLVTRVFGGEAVNEEEPDQGYLVDMQLLDVEHTARMNVLLEELDEVGNDAIKKMKASEKVCCPFCFHCAGHTYIHVHILTNTFRVGNRCKNRPSATKNCRGNDVVKEFHFHLITGVQLPLMCHLGCDA